MMSHEIRTPMNGILGMANILRTTNLAPRQQDFVKTITDSGEALLTIINDILDFSKIEAGRLDIERHGFVIEECVESAIELVASRIGKKNLDLAYHIDANVPTGIVSDSNRVRQILLNLLSNAVKFTESGEVVIHISAERVAGADEWEIHFSVRDTGIGIPEDRIEKLFKSFSQVDTSMARRYGGTGLGLAISKRLVELLGGSVSVESAAGKGSTFHFTIRAQEAHGLSPSYLQGSDGSRLKGKSALIVDDNKTNLKVLSLHLESWGIKSTAADSGKGALSVIEDDKNCFDVVILDMQMPEMTGIEVAERIRYILKENTPPLVMLSSIGGEVNTREYDLFDAYLTKPAKASQIYNALLELFAGQRGKRIFHADYGVGAQEYVADPEMARKLPLRILLAEDNPTNRQLATLTLEQFGYTADIADNGLKALDALRMNSYDVVLMDVQMPEMDGLQCSRTIRAEMPKHRQPYIIALTANALISDREECIQAGMDDYISKPFTPEELAGALKRARPEAAERPVCPILNPEAFRRLAATLGKKTPVMLPVLIETFLKNVDDMLVNADAGIKETNFTEVRRIAHTLKSNFKNFGADELSAICAELEEMAKGGVSLEGAGPMLERISAGYKEVRAALTAHEWKHFLPPESGGAA